MGRFEKTDSKIRRVLSRESDFSEDFEVLSSSIRFFKILLFKLKCLYGQQGFCGFGISITSKNVFKPKKLNSNAFFAMKSSFELPASATPNEVDRVMEDWCRKIKA